MGIFFLLALAGLSAAAEPASRPNIVIIIADDLGWNDVGFHGSSQIPTPNIDALAYSGLILNRYYVAPLCTPSRSALMTGRHPIHTGLQHGVLMGGERRGLGLGERLLPQLLAEGGGYSRHLVGKWHLGSFRREYTPTARGFQSHFGYWTGHQDYYDHTAMESNMWGLDMREDAEPAWGYHGRYSTDLFTERAVGIIREHGRTRRESPLFLVLAHAAVHSANPYNPLPVADSLAAAFQNVTSDYNRQRFAGMLTKLDESVGRVVDALLKSGLLSNTVILFTTDNGGPAAGFNLNAASNWPLRGVKNTLWEGGVRGVGVLWSRLVKRPARVANQLVHITDWLPTLLSAAGIDPSGLANLDGVDMWKALSENGPSNRTGVLHNIDDIYGNAALTVEDWKIVKGTNYNGTWDGWYGPSGRSTKYRYDPKSVINSMAGKAFAALGKKITLDQIRGMRQQAEVVCDSNEVGGSPCHPLEAPCLFNLRRDPCETNNLASKFPDVLAELEGLLEEMNATAVAPTNLPVDPASNPDAWGHVWTNFGDYPPPQSP